MRIIIDTMSGDNAPLEILKGTVQAAKKCNADFLLVGNETELRYAAKTNSLDISHFEIMHTDSVIRMEDDPISAFRTKKDSSMMMGLKLLAEGKGDAFVSAGNTGALFTGATFIVKRASGISRAAIATVLPGSKPCLLLDSGANLSVTPEQLEEFALMGSAYMRKMYHIEKPTVGLLNNGTEDGKGTPLQVETNKRLAVLDQIAYVGNVEANTVLHGACDVLVTDGFTGNIFLKATEGMGKLVLKSVKAAFMKNAITKLSALLFKNTFSEMKQKFDAKEHGGAPILGIAKPVIKAHGSSDARAFQNAVLQAIRYAESGSALEI